MNPTQAGQLAALLRQTRLKLGLSASEVARRAGVTTGTVTRIELGQIASPKADSLTAIAEVLDLPKADIFTVAGWVPGHELPTLRPYLRSKYQALSEADAGKVEAYIEQIGQQYGSHGPANREDEH